MAGIVVEEPQFRVADEAIDIDPLADAGQAEPVTLLLHKPAGYAMIPDAGGLAAECLRLDRLWAEDHSGKRPLKLHFARLTPCLPLETAASGLVVYSQDWKVVRKLTEDAAMVENEMVADVAGDSDKLGLKVAELTKEKAQQLKVQGDHGVVVTEVQPESLADRAGIAEGDLVREINGVRINGVGDYSKAIAQVKKGTYLKLLLRRGDSSLFVALKRD